MYWCTLLLARNWSGRTKQANFTFGGAHAAEVFERCDESNDVAKAGNERTKERLFFFFFWEFRNKAKNDKVLHTFHRKRPLISRGKAFSLLFPIHFQIHYTPEGKKKD